MWHDSSSIFDTVVAALMSFKQQALKDGAARAEVAVVLPIPNADALVDPGSLAPG